MVITVSRLGLPVDSLVWAALPAPSFTESMGQIEVLLTSCQKGEFRDIDMLNKYILVEETGIGARYKHTDFVTFCP